MSAHSIDSTALAPGLPRTSEAEREDDPTSFGSLRKAAIEWSQAASWHGWTDYNLHDPGITVLEAACYALTEIGYRIDFKVADHLCDADGSIDSTRHGLFPPSAILPCAPTTSTDLTGTIIAADGRIHDARLVPIGSGLHRLALMIRAGGQDGTPASANHTDGVRHALQYAAAQVYRANRPLGEDIDDAVDTIHLERCQLVLDARLSGTRDPARVLAEIFDACDQLISPRTESSDRIVQAAAGQSYEALYTGPSTRVVMAGQAGRTVPPDSISSSQLRAAILAVPGVSDIARLDIRIDRQPGTDCSVTWDGQVLKWNADAVRPQLATPEIASNKAFSDIRLSHTASGSAGTARVIGSAHPGRSTAAIAIDRDACAQRYADLAATRRTNEVRRIGSDEPGDRLPRGTAMSAVRYHSIGGLLPPVYGLTETAHGGDRRVAKAPEPFAAYLALVDQAHASMTGLVDNLGDLFSADAVDGSGALRASRWPRVLTDREVVGIQMLYAQAESQGAQAQINDGARAEADLIGRVRAAVFDPRDQISLRRSRILDFLIALHGEHLDEDLFGQFIDYCDAGECAVELLTVKALFLANIDHLSRNRGTGTMPGVLPSDVEGTLGFHHRLALKLGFSRPEARRLAVDAAAPMPPQADPFDPAQAIKPIWPVGSDKSSHVTGHSGPPFAALQQGRLLQPILLQHGLHRRNYRYHAGQLCVTGGPAQGWLALGAFDDAGLAGHGAAAIRAACLEQAHGAEGLHVIEHVLLRHRLQPELRVDLALRLTVALPNWTARTARADFQSFAEATVRNECPAHLAVAVLWLDPEAMARLERALERWSGALARHLVAIGSGQPAVLDVDAAADAVWASIHPTSADGA